MASSVPCLALAGSSGSGKSTLCWRVAQEASALGRPCAGFIAVRRLASADHPGLDLVDAANGSRVSLAEFDRPTGGPSTGRWHFHPEAFRAGLAWCDRATPDALLIIDEIGPLELVQGLGWAPALPVIARHPGPVLVSVRPAMLDLLERAVATRFMHRVDIHPDDREAAAVRVCVRLGLAT